MCCVKSLQIRNVSCLTEYIYTCVFTTVQVFCTLTLPVTCKINPIYCEPIYFVRLISWRVLRDDSIRQRWRWKPDGSASSILSCEVLYSVGPCLTAAARWSLVCLSRPWSCLSRAQAAAPVALKITVQSSRFVIVIDVEFVVRRTVDICRAVLLTFCSTTTLFCASLLQHWKKIRNRTNKYVSC